MVKHFMQRNQNEWSNVSFPVEKLYRFESHRNMMVKRIKSFSSCTCVRRYHSIEVAVTIQGLRNWQTNTPQERKGTAFNFLLGKFLTPYSYSILFHLWLAPQERCDVLGVSRAMRATCCPTPGHRMAPNSATATPCHGACVMSFTAMAPCWFFKHKPL